MAAAFYMVLFFGMWGLYATFVSIACSQLEKLRANLLYIRQKPDTPEQDSGAETDTEEEETQLHTSQEVFLRMQKQLSDCIRHHQMIIRYAPYFAMIISSSDAKLRKRVLKFITCIK
jgi:hypothetical protein